MTDIAIPDRPGPVPRTTDTNPHTQLEQNPSRELYDELRDRLFSVPDTHEEPSKISVPGARALILDEGVDPGPREAFLIDREFCHLHPPDDGSLHMALPEPVVAEANAAGWTEPHPVADRGLIPNTIVMVYAPRDSDEIDTVLKLVDASYRFASGSTTHLSLLNLVLVD